MARVVHVIGNGDSASLYLREKRNGLKLACNQIPFEVPEKYATCMVDFKMMNAIDKRGLEVPGTWLLGYRPKVYMDKNPTFYMKRAQQIKEFYTHLPQYCWKDGVENMGEGYTRFNCGHFAVHYACNKLKADTIHMYGFDSMFDFNMNSFSDLVLHSDRGNTNNNRLQSNWRPLWEGMFAEFPDVKFIPHYYHDAIKVPHQGNVETRVYSLKEKEKVELGPDGLPDFDSISLA